MSSNARDISEEMGCDDWMLLTYIHDRKEGEAFEEEDYVTVEDEDLVEDHEDNTHYFVIQSTRSDENDEETNCKNYYKVLEENDGCINVVYMATSGSDDDDHHYRSGHLSMSSIGKLTGYETYEKYEDFALVYESLAQCKGFAEAYKTDCTMAVSGETPEEAKKRLAMNAKARAQLLLQLDRDGPLFMMIRNEKSAKEMWTMKQGFYTPTADADTVIIKEEEWNNCRLKRATGNPSKFMEANCVLCRQQYRAT